MIRSYLLRSYPIATKPIPSRLMLLYAVPLLSILMVIDSSLIYPDSFFCLSKISFVISYNFVALLLIIPMIISNIFRPFSR
ncbi:uncharacterized protein F5891DRAFT_1058813 [Suillus fuscotomentosus]|uniref:Uncharacterized protein n=1 Tax=Suillus fuscotomentosus TaxID=1912939 RepID=A0AAD4DZ16_9AGAM|nr:uncharacterized protein F5891DRAFT_1058813 [Suillus fuscotomentosus]KAG1895489.1 hypothetical protein F5891DRAFT_1058813 [Suillus fuscotomentosus]